MQIIFFVVLFVIISVILLIGITLIGNFQPTQQYGLMLGYPDVYIKESKGITKCDDGFSASHRGGTMAKECGTHTLWDISSGSTIYHWEYWKDQNKIITKCKNPEYETGKLIIDITINERYQSLRIDDFSKDKFDWTPPKIIRDSCINIQADLNSSYSILVIVLVVISAGAILYYIREGF